jgi:hypothetical protein
MKSRAVLIVLTCIFLASAMLAQPSETRFTDSSGAYSFAVPEKWKSETNTEGFALANSEKTVIVIVKSHTYANFEEFSADANLERDGLELIGKPQTITNGYAFRTAKRTPQGIVVIDTCVLFSTFGGGVVIVGLSDEKNATDSFDSGVAIANSVRFASPTVSSNGPFVSLLKGRQLLYLYTASGFSERKDIYLCSSGEFYQSTDMGGFNPNDSGDGSFGSRRSSHGMWSVNGSSLLLRFRNGGTTQFRLSKRPASNEIGLNGQRFFVRQQNVCQ